MTVEVDRAPGLRERNRIRTRDDILDSAAALLGEFGYNGTTLDDVAKHAGLSRKTIYAYFPNGRDEMVQAAYVRIAKQVEQRGMLARESLTDPVDRIVALAEALIRTAITPEGRFYGILGPDVTPVLTSVMGSTSRSFTQLIHDDLAESMAQSNLPPATPVDELAHLLTGTIRAAGNIAAVEPRRAKLLTEAVRMMAAGLLSGSADE
ncbi:TetR/AcrR family transcriptional regulator [Subtercola sp. YIM 133946]|uniref:TetR/AcrR family transcriptional regulator n=1 Tax=Subtercola sp. YIM 133946 TaxID=3118909 RepID=UPI002F951629